MGILKNFADVLKGKNKKSEEETLATGASPSMHSALSGGYSNNSGVTVNETTALNNSAVFAAVRLLTETISTLPIHLYEKEEDGRKRVVEDHPLAQLIRKPNPEMTRNVFVEVLQGHIETYGKAFAEIVHNPKTGYPVSLHPVSPGHIQIQRNEKTKKLEYKYTPTGAIVPEWKMLHIVGFGSNGIDSYSPIQLARQSIGVGLAAEEFHARYFKQGTQIGGFLSMEGELSDEAYSRLKEQMASKYKGLQKSHGLIILENNTKYEPVKLSMEDAQFLQTREFTVKEIARWFGVKAHMINDLSNATFSNIEHQGMEAVRYTFRPRVVRWEEALNSKLILPHEQGKLYFKFSLEGLLRGDVKTRYEAYRMGLMDGWLNADEVRAMEDLEPQVDDMGKAYFIPVNMMNKNYAIEGRNVPNYGTPSTEEAKEEEQVQEKEELSEQALKEERQKKSAIKRRSKTDSYKTLLKKQVEQLIKKEVSVVKEALELLEHSGADEFIDYVERNFEEIKQDIPERFLPTFTAIAEDIIPSIQDELNKSTDVSHETEEFIENYVESFANRHVGYQVGQIRKIRAEENATNIKSRVEETVLDWKDNVAEKIVTNEMIKSENAFTKAVYIAMGVRKLKSVAMFDNTCPFCRALHGKVVGVEGYFLQKGEEFKPEGATYALVPKGNISHPPYHLGCTCQIVAEE